MLKNTAIRLNIYLLLVSSVCAASTWDSILLDTKNGAVALDGSPARLYLQEGVGEDSSKYILFFEGGGWCESVQDCAARSLTALGSSKFESSGYSGRDLLQNNCTVNPYFCNWSKVYAQYLDGISRSSDVDEPVHWENQTIYFRGHRILEETISTLLLPNGPGAGLPSLAKAPRLLVTGSSAGGLTTYLHIDEISNLVKEVNPSIDVRAVPEVGFFIDAESIWQGSHIYTDVYARTASIGNVTARTVNENCAKNTPLSNFSYCFMAQYTYPYIESPIFIVNSMVDEWQTQNILGPNTITLPAATPYEAFLPCTKNPTSGCNATQAAQWTHYAVQFKNALSTAIAQQPRVAQAKNGGVITSCPIHTTLIGGLSHKIKVQGKSLYQYIVDWMSDTPGSAGTWTMDVDYPGNPSCPKASSDDWNVDSGISMINKEVEKKSTIKNTEKVTTTSKRGLSMAVSVDNEGTFCADFAATRGTISWTYSWGLYPANTSCNVPFEPMFWGGKSVLNSSEIYVTGSSSVVLGFNEPNGADQSNLTPADAAKIWPLVAFAAELHNLSLVAPVPSGTDTKWLDSFFSLCNGCESQIDFIALHPYACTADALKSSLDVWSKYGKKLWVTEFNCGDGMKNATAAEHLAYMKIALPILDADDRVARYAWMSGRNNKVPGSALFRGNGGALTELGAYYVKPQ